MKKRLIIEGMTCKNCVRHITEALEELPEVETVKVDLDDMSAVVDLSDDVSEDDLRDVIDDAGYELVEVEDEDED